ncbi:MAG: hypothetical protein LN588_03455 [Rickettsia endosymbiont of Bryobia graminum]|nr:hypothetical protein [Rickettsia endosymbiont of Bryobia graminum]
MSNKYNKIFHNSNPKIKLKGILDILKWKLKSSQPKWPEKVTIKNTTVPFDRINNDLILY